MFSFILGYSPEESTDFSLRDVACIAQSICFLQFIKQSIGFVRFEKVIVFQGFVLYVHELLALIIYHYFIVIMKTHL